MAAQHSATRPAGGPRHTGIGTGGALPLAVSPANGDDDDDEDDEDGDLEDDPGDNPEDDPQDDPDPQDDARFRRCWRRQDCRSCLGVAACSWCPFSAACVPNDHRVPALAPAWDGDLVCPYWAERWELRTRPLGCQVSTITSLTAVVAGASTLAAALLIWLAVQAWRWGRQWGRRRRRRRRRPKRTSPGLAQAEDRPGSPSRPAEPTAAQPADAADEQTPLLAPA